MPLKLSNNAIGTLVSSMTNSSTSVVLAPGQGAKFPVLGSGDWFPITVVRASNPNQFEIMHATALGGDVLTVTRAREGTTAITFSVGDIVEHRLTRDAMDRDFVRLGPSSLDGVRVSVSNDGGNLKATVHADDKELAFGTAATRDVGTGANTVAAGNDTRITGAAQKSANLSDLANVTTARTNLGLGTAAERNVMVGLRDYSQGRVVTTGGFGIGLYNSSVETANAQTEFVSGLFSYTGGAAGSPSGAGGAVLVARHGRGLRAKLAMSGGGAPRAWLTNGSDGGTDQAWLEMLTQSSPIFTNGQTRQIVTSQRSIDTTYTNTTGKPIGIAITVWGGGGGNTTCGALFLIGGTIAGRVLASGNSNNSGSGTFSGVVLPGETYRVESIGGTSNAIYTWEEIR